MFIDLFTCRTALTDKSLQGLFPPYICSFLNCGSFWFSVYTLPVCSILGRVLGTRVHGEAKLLFCFASGCHFKDIQDLLHLPLPDHEVWEGFSWTLAWYWHPAQQIGYNAFVNTLLNYFWICYEGCHKVFSLNYGEHVKGIVSDSFSWSQFK